MSFPGIPFTINPKSTIVLRFCRICFKAINDQFGHFVGDDVLQRFSKLAKSAARSADIVARFGGEEFVIVLVGGTAETAKQFAIRLIAQARNLAIASESQNVGFTVSIGVAQYLPGEGIDSVIARADDALYGAKRAMLRFQKLGISRRWIRGYQPLRVSFSI